jgi:hypothetical protein
LSTLNFNGDIAYNNCSVSPCGNPFRSGYYSVGSHFTQDGVAFSGGPNLEFVYGAYGGSPDFPILNDSHDTGNLGIGVPSSSAVSLTLGDYVGSYPATITLNTGATVYELTLPQIPSTTFIGFVSSGSYITSLSLNDSGGSQGGLSLEDVQFTPEPGFYVVTGLLLIGLFVMRMRSAAASRSI